MLPIDENDNRLQVFTPDPALSATLTLGGGNTITWTIPAEAKAYTFSPTTAVVRKLGANSHGPTFAANPDLPYGPFGIKRGTTQIVFTGASGQTIEIEAMK